ncbi:hypothetical protein [Luteolibacter soli]|uniref:Uncharacterized protein n=1 Tax=Luteolibacter soli TaxID=3135280 RepID=A0ABU9AXT9_9BACT
MKTIRSLVLLLLAIPLALCPAQEENPYLTQSAPKAPAGPGGDSFLTLTEHIIVPSDLLDSWLANHSMAKDASELRTAAQKWIEEGTATIDSTALTAGTVGPSLANESIVEQIYATEYMPSPSPEDWTFATSFETRNCGYSIDGNSVREQGELVVRAENYFVRMLPHRAYDRVSEKTRQPDDIFIPRFRSIATHQALAGFDESYSDDPFASASPPPRTKTRPSYPAGKTHLALRVDEDLPEPAIKWPLEEKRDDEAADPLPEDRPVRLIFVRSDKIDSPPESTEPLPADYQLSVKLVSVDHLTLSAWLQGRDLATAAKEMNEVIETWNEDEKVNLISTLTGGVRNGTRTLLEDIKKLEYPTYYKPGKREPSADGKSTQLGLAVPGDLETRNLGISLETEISPGAGDPVMLLSLRRVLLGCYTVHHRVLRDGEWIADMTMPRFSENNWLTSLRVKKGEWMFVGSGSGFGEKGELDPSRAVLAFVKVD